MNLSGGFLLAMLFFLALQHGTLSPGARAFLFIGLFGGYTTMSTFTLETVAMLGAGQWFSGVANVFLNAGICMGGAFLGRAVGLWLGGP